MYDLRAGFDEQELKDVYKVVERLPVIDVKYTIVAVDDKNEALENQSLEEGGEALCMINLKRTNRGKDQKVLSSRFPKPKEAGWFLIIGN